MSEVKNIRLSGNEKINFISNLSTMIGAGIPIYESIESLLEDAKGSQKKILEQLLKDLSAGHHLHISFAKFPKIFDRISISLIKAAEEAGKLETTLNDLKNNLQKEMEFTDKIKSALTYPFLVMIVFIVILFAMLIVVIPRIATVFTRLKVQLPLPTKILIFFSNNLLAYWPYLSVIFFLSVIAISVFYYKKRELFLSVLFSLPLVSKLMKEIDLARFARSMYLLLTSGLPFPYALELAQEVVIKKQIAKTINKARTEAIGGKQFSEALRIEKGIFPNLVIKLIEVGEKTGKLDESMKNISKRMDYTVEKSLNTITALLEPVMLIFVAITVGGMMMAIIAPIYGLIGKVGQM